MTSHANPQSLLKIYLQAINTFDSVLLFSVPLEHVRPFRAPRRVRCSAIRTVPTTLQYGSRNTERGAERGTDRHVPTERKITVERMQHLARAHCKKRHTYHVRMYVPRTYASSTVSRHFGAETKILCAIALALTDDAWFTLYSPSLDVL